MYNFCPKCKQQTMWVGEVLGDPAAECKSCGHTPNQIQDAEFECSECHEPSTDVTAVVSGELVCANCLEEDYRWCPVCCDYSHVDDMKGDLCKEHAAEKERKAREREREMRNDWAMEERRLAQ